MKMKLLLVCAACVMSLLIAPTVFAAGAGNDHRASHGGQFQEIKGHHGIEMVVTADVTCSIDSAPIIAARC